MSAQHPINRVVLRPCCVCHRLFEVLAIVAAPEMMCSEKCQEEYANRMCSAQRREERRTK